MSEDRGTLAERKTADHTAKAEEYLAKMDERAGDGDTLLAVRYAALAEAHMHRVDHFLQIASVEALIP